jgi:hypothetical protein
VSSGGSWRPVLHCGCLRPPLGAQDLPCHVGCHDFPRSTWRPPPTCGVWCFCKSSLFLLSHGFDMAQFRLTVQLVALLLHIRKIAGSNLDPVCHLFSRWFRANSSTLNVEAISSSETSGSLPTTSLSWVVHCCRWAVAACGLARCAIDGPIMGRFDNISLSTVTIGLVHQTHFDPEDGGRMYLRNVNTAYIHTVRRINTHSDYTEFFCGFSKFLQAYMYML